MSNGYDFVRFLYAKSPFRSYRKLNAQLSAALTIAIEARLDFEPGDIQKLASNCGGGYWGAGSEMRYALAIREGNIGFARAYECHFKRQPFMLGGLRVGVRRLFDWQGERVMVTSFAKDQGSMIACAYPGPYPARGGLSPHEDWAEYVPEGKPSRRFRITLDELRAHDRALREAEKASKANGATEGEE